MDTPPLGEQELEVLTHISQKSPVTARAVAEHFATERGLARTTVLTVIERLRKKGYLERKRTEGDEGIFVYVPRVPQNVVVQGIVGHFVERTLGGSVSPMVAYLANARTVSDQDLAELEALVEGLRSRREEGDA